MGIMGLIFMGIGVLILGGITFGAYYKTRTKEGVEVKRQAEVQKPKNQQGCMRIILMHERTGREIIFKESVILGRETLVGIPFYCQETIRLREGELWIEGDMAYLCTSNPSYKGARGIKINGDELIPEEKVRLFMGTHEVEIRDVQFLMHIQKIKEEE